MYLLLAHIIVPPPNTTICWSSLGTPFLLCASHPNCPAQTIKHVSLPRCSPRLRLCFLAKSSVFLDIIEVSIMPPPNFSFLRKTIDWPALNGSMLDINNPRLLPWRSAGENAIFLSSHLTLPQRHYRHSASPERSAVAVCFYGPLNSRTR